MTDNKYQRMIDYLVSDKAKTPEEAAVYRAIGEYTSLWREIATSGRPPHTDYWHQSIWERENAIKTALSNYKGGK